MQTFETHSPIHAHVEIGSGSVTLTATDTTETTVEVTGRGADATEVTFESGELRVIGPKQASFFRDASIHVALTLPHESSLALRSGSADLKATGTLGVVDVKSGSGDVLLETVGEARIKTGSGDISITTTRGDLSIKSGSGDVKLGTAAAVQVTTGSGDLIAGTITGPTAVKTGSGDVSIETSGGDLSFMTGSGELGVRRAERGRVNVKGASGSVRLGVPRGLPVWTDINTVSGHVRSDLESAGQPADGQDHLEVRATTVSGHVHLLHSN